MRRLGTRCGVERSVDLLVHLALALFHGRPSLVGPTRFAAARRARLLLELQGGVRQGGQAALYDREPGRDSLRVLTAPRSASSLRLPCTCTRPPCTSCPLYCASTRDAPGHWSGTIEDATIVKLFRDEPAVSYLSYPTFERDPHPALWRASHCDLQGQRVRFRISDGRVNPPILHRKELFVSTQHPCRAKFARLTAAEERGAGLYAKPEAIGTQEGWAEACRAAGVALRGHRVVRAEGREDPKRTVSPADDGAAS